jgi:hypothetical protein
MGSNPKARFATLMRDQLVFLRASCEAYDSGVEAEAIRIATVLRTVFKDKGTRTTSLLTHMGMWQIPILSSKVESVEGGDHFKAFVNFQIDFSSLHPVCARPLLRTGFCEIPRNTWWDGEPVYTHKGVEYSRAKLVGAAADRDGGAHVDGQLDDFYEELIEGLRGITLDASNLTFSGTPLFDVTQPQATHGLHFAMLRQFGHEVLASAKHYRWLRGAA